MSPDFLKRLQERRKRLAEMRVALDSAEQRLCDALSLLENVRTKAGQVPMKTLRAAVDLVQDARADHGELNSLLKQEENSEKRKS